MNPLISIIVPVYKVEKYLNRCMESIVNQTYSELEIILVDDGSPDNCPVMCDDWAMKDARIKVIHKENGGIGYARNSGIEIAQGEYIMFVDSDDYISLDAVEVLYKRLISDKSDFAIGKHIDVYDDGSKNDGFCLWMTDTVLDKSEVLNHFGVIKYFPVAAYAKLYKKSVFDNIRYPELSCGEDMWIFPQIIEKCEQVSVVNKDIYFYYQRNNSIVHSKSEKAKRDTVVATLNLLNYFLKQKAMKSAKNWFIRAVNESALLSDTKESIKLFKDNLSKTHIKYLIKSAGLKTRIKWILLYIPFSFNMIRGIKNICFWRK